MLVQLYLDFELIPFNISTCTTVMDIKKHISKTVHAAFLPLIA